METIQTDQAPAAVGPYAQAVKTGNMLFCSGQIGLVPATGKLAGADIRHQGRQMLDNLSAVLKAAGYGLDDVVKTTVFLTNMKDFPIFNEIYAGCFGSCKPARSTVQVTSLPLGARVEIECIAVKE